jgi:hypothetical protein
MARCWERALRRAELPVSITEGFSPRPKVHFGLALSTSHESLGEYLDIDGWVWRVWCTTEVNTCFTRGYVTLLLRRSSQLVTSTPLELEYYHCSTSVRLFFFTDCILSPSVTVGFLETSYDDTYETVPGDVI